MIPLDTPRCRTGREKTGRYRHDGGLDFLFGLNDLCKKYITKEMIVLELGANRGVSTELFAQYAKEVVTVDVKTTKELKERLNRCPNIKFHQMPFKTFFSKCETFFDIVYIDGAHDYTSVKNDILDCSLRLKKDGLFSGHDFFARFPGVKKAVLELFVNNKIEYFSDKSWLVPQRYLKRKITLL